jgi:Flp pilus assembly protein TadB
MDHEAYENEMIDDINRNAKDKNMHDSTRESTSVLKQYLFSKEDKKIMRRGLKRTLLALVTAALFALAICGLVAVAVAPGYLAVLLFFASILSVVCAFISLYAQGIIDTESYGDGK